MDSPKLTSRPHFAGLDGLRGIAALAVVVGHTLGEDHSSGPQNYFLAVDFFLMLSGFVVAHAYGERLQSQRMSVWQFFKIRLIRLHPLLILGTLLTPLYRLGIAHKEAGVTTANLLIATLTGLLCIPWNPLPNEGAAFPMDGPQWSLSVEYVLNLLYAAIAPWLDFGRLILLVLLSIVAWAAIVITQGTISVGAFRATAWLAYVRGLFPFFFGILIHRLAEAGKLPRLRISWGIQAAVLLLILLSPLKAPAPLLEIAAVFIVFQMIMIGGRDDSFGPRASRVMLWMGALSYPIYILHIPLVHPMARILDALLPPAALPLMFAAQIAVVIAVAFFAHMVIEKPAVRALRGRLQGTR